jgi:hypothetical protein
MNGVTLTTQPLGSAIHQQRRLIWQKKKNADLNVVGFSIVKCEAVPATCKLE